MFFQTHLIRFILALICLSARGEIVINEIFYHAPNKIEDLQFVEIHNTTTNQIDLSGWKLTRGIEFPFPPGSKIEAKGYLVIAANSERFQEYYGFVPEGVFQGALSRKGMRLDLVSSVGTTIDSVKYKDSVPWPTAADGYSSSLERICPAVKGDIPENWASSSLPIGEVKPAGTPGRRNGSFSAKLPPTISDVKLLPVSPQPDQEIKVDALVVDSAALRDVTILYRAVAPGRLEEEISIPMYKSGPRQFSGIIPGQKAHQLLRIRIRAIDHWGTERIYPGPNEPRPALSCFVRDPSEDAQVPMLYIINTSVEDKLSMDHHLQSTSGSTEEQQLRVYARMQLYSMIQLSSLWYELAAVQQTPFEQLSKLRVLFLNKTSERDRLIRQFVEGGTNKEIREKVGRMADTFYQDLAHAMEPFLSDQQKAQLPELIARHRPARGPIQLTPETVLRRFLKLEDTFFQLTSHFDLREPVLNQVIDTYRTAVRHRKDLAPLIEALNQNKVELADVHEKLDEIQSSLGEKLLPVLSHEQKDQWKSWIRESEFPIPGQIRAPVPRRPQGQSAFIYVNTQTNSVEVHDFINITERNSGLNVHFHDAHLFHGMSTLNLLYEINDRFMLAEPLAYEVYRKVGVLAPSSDHVRLNVDGRPLGLYLAIEQPNRAFLRRNHVDDRGDLYKLLWFGRGVEGQHEKKTNPNAGHTNLVHLLDKLQRSSGDPAQQWQLIQENFDVPQVINYFAVNMCLSHWDGFFNNYFAYHDIHGTGKWAMFPWDQDKTWGFHDGLKPEQIFCDMPLTFGMEGDRPPGYPKDRPAPRGFAGDTTWWRPGGYFSKPLLANPHFRKQFLIRTKEIIQTVYTEEVFSPIIESMGNRLSQEVRLRATFLKQDPDQAHARLQANIASLKAHLNQRRKFLLNQPEIKTTLQDG